MRKDASSRKSLCCTICQKPLTVRERLTSKTRCSKGCGETSPAKPWKQEDTDNWNNKVSTIFSSMKSAEGGTTRLPPIGLSSPKTSPSHRKNNTRSSTAPSISHERVAELLKEKREGMQKSREEVDEEAKLLGYQDDSQRKLLAFLSQFRVVFGGLFVLMLGLSLALLAPETGSSAPTQLDGHILTPSAPPFASDAGASPSEVGDSTDRLEKLELTVEQQQLQLQQQQQQQQRLEEQLSALEQQLSTLQQQQQQDSLKLCINSESTGEGMGNGD